MAISKYMRSRWMCWNALVAALSMALAPYQTLNAAEPLQTATPVANATKTAAVPAIRIDKQWLTPKVCFVAATRPRDLLKSPIGEYLPSEVLEAFGNRDVGFDLNMLEEVLFAVEAPDLDAPPPQLIVVIKLAEKFDFDRLLPTLREHVKPEKFQGKSALRDSSDPSAPLIVQHDEQTLVIGSEDYLKKLSTLPESEKKSQLIDQTTSQEYPSNLMAYGDITIVRPFIHMGLQKAAEDGAQDLLPFVDIVSHLSIVRGQLGLLPGTKTELVVESPNEKSAKRAERLLQLARDKLVEQQQEKTRAMLQSADVVEQAFGRYLQRMGDKQQSGLTIKRQGNAFVLFEHVNDESGSASAFVMLAIIGVLISLLLPAVQAARESARRMVVANNFKLLMLAILTYEDDHKSLPPQYSVDKAGKPLLSWRVHILPYMEQQELYDQFHLDEPWDSPHNIKLVDKMPEAFAHPLIDVQGKTVFLGVSGPNAIMNGSTGVTLKALERGTANTIALVEVSAENAVEWTKPTDWTVDELRPLEGLGGNVRGGFSASFCDGTTRFVDQNIDPQLFVELCSTTAPEEATDEAAEEDEASESEDEDAEAVPSNE